MLTENMNEKLARVGPGTPAGDLLRRYWQPVAASIELKNRPTKKVRILGEDLVLYRDKGGSLGLIGERCPHRRVNLYYGIPEAEGLRCPYHGWMFNASGQCVDTPAEPPDSTFKERVTTAAYPVQELGGLIFAYLGPSPTPLLPRWDLFVWDNVVRYVGATLVPCNWLQAMENSMDPVHLEWLHGYYFDWLLDDVGINDKVYFQKRHKKIGFDRFEHGIIKRRVIEGQTEEDDDWRIGHPVVFPNMLRVGTGGTYSFQIRVPVDDTHTWHLWYVAYRPGVPVPPQQDVPLYDVPMLDSQTGDHITDHVDGQDMMCWVTQGDIAERHLERLAQSDLGIIMYRNLLREQIELVESGQEPMNIFRDPSRNAMLELPQEEHKYGYTFTERAARRNQARYNPELAQVVALFEQAQLEAAAGRAKNLLPHVVPPELVRAESGNGHANGQRNGAAHGHTETHVAGFVKDFREAVLLP